jgi:hypothetical protein
MEYVPLHSLRVQLYHKFYSIALFVFSINRIRQNVCIYFNIKWFFNKLFLKKQY